MSFRGSEADNFPRDGELARHGLGPCNAASPFFHIDGSPATINVVVPAGTTVLAPPSGTRISMLDDVNNQDNCKGATINLAFTSN